MTGVQTCALPISARAATLNYNYGLYFITICTKDKVHYFGSIVQDNDGQYRMKLTPIGIELQKNLDGLSAHYPYAELIIYTIMPNHIHAIVALTTPLSTDHPVETERVPSEFDRHNSMQMKQISNKKGKLSVVVGGFKSAVTKYSNQHNIPFGWQERFHDHIIRDHAEFCSIATYIENNVAKWGKS